MSGLLRILGEHSEGSSRCGIRLVELMLDPVIELKVMIEQAELKLANLGVQDTDSQPIEAAASISDGASSPNLVSPSETDPQAEEQNDLEIAMQISKAEIPHALNDDGVVICRLDRRVNSLEVREALLESPELDDCRSAVLQSACELQPDWSNGAWILIPMTKEVFDESRLQLTGKDILMLETDVDAVKRALKQIPRSNRKTPKLQPVSPADRVL